MGRRCLLITFLQCVCSITGVVGAKVSYDSFRTGDKYPDDDDDNSYWPSGRHIIPSLSSDTCSHGRILSIGDKEEAIRISQKM